ncbi:MAG TPA: hypothetical protein VFN10_01805 [Thermoanaerobaculia bacterium]|nr:hypothetical protein [Thermoanaerobaculia bacterium]
MKLAVALTAALSLFSASLHAGCNMNPRWENGVLRWNPVAGAAGFYVQETLDGVTSTTHFVQSNSINLPHRASVDTSIRFLVIAQIDPRTAAVQTFDACVEQLDTIIPADPAFRAMTRKAIVPLVGSTPGAFGGRFKTSIKLTATNSNQRGTLVFHPAGRPAADDDPSLPYNLRTPEDTFVVDDFVTQLGLSGVGSLDIIPAEGQEPVLPEIDVRLFNDTPNGTFGTNAAAVLPFDYLAPAAATIDVPEKDFRVNAGFRALSAVSLKVLIYGTDHRLRDFKDRSFPAGWVQFGSVSDLAGTTVAPGESVTLLFGGSAIPFYTLTENRTNDPTLIVPAARPASHDVGRFVE